MRKRVVATTAALAAFTAFASPALAATVDFEDQAAFRCDFSGSSSGGLSYSNSFAFCYYSPSNPADFPTPITSTVMASGYSDTTFNTTSGGAFNLGSVDLAFGPFNHGGLTSDTTFVTGNLVGGGTLTTTLTVGYGFQTYNLNWSNLSSVTFSALQGGSEYLAFDNLTYSAAGAVPEPATWALMILGFGAVGGAMRRRQSVAAKVHFA